MEGSRGAIDGDQYSVQRLADRAEISDLLARYCRAVDRLDYDELRATYQPDATDNHGAYSGSVAGFIEYVRDRHVDIPFSMHSISNCIIEFTGPDAAVVETYVTCLQTYAPGATDSLTVISGKPGGGNGATHLLLAGRFVDEISRRDDGWRFASRHTVYDFGLMLDGESLAFGESFLTGRRSHRDPVYGVLAPTAQTPSDR